MNRTTFIERVDGLMRDEGIATSNDFVSKMDALVKEANTTAGSDTVVLYGIIALNAQLHAMRCGEDCLRHYTKQGMKFEAEHCHKSLLRKIA